LKAADSGKITSDKTRYNFSNASNNIVAGDNTTITNNNINPSQSSTPQVKATISKKEVITSTIIGSSKSVQIRSQTVSREELTTIYNNSSNNSSKNSLLFYTKEAFNMFNKPLKDNSVERSVEMSLKYSGRVKEDSPFFFEGLNNAEESQLPYLNPSHVESFISRVDDRTKWSPYTTVSVNKNKELPSIQTEEESVSKGFNIKNIILNFFGKGKNTNLPSVPQQSDVAVTANHPPFMRNRNLSEVSEIASISQLPVVVSQSRLALLAPDSVLQTSDCNNLAKQIENDLFCKKTTPAESVELPESGVYDVTIKTAKKSKSLPDLFRIKQHENITSDYKYINYVLIKTIGNADPEALNEFLDKNLWIEYDSKKDHKRGFIFVSRKTSNQFNFDLVPVKKSKDLISYLSNHGDKYQTKDLMIETLTTQTQFYHLNDIKMILNPNLNFKNTDTLNTSILIFIKPYVILSNLKYRDNNNKWKT
jgi:hypothetical protein